MNRSWIVGTLAAATVFLIYRNLNARQNRKVPIQEAANRLREAWADNHTVA
jgi:hypothetical protein